MPRASGRSVGVEPHRRLSPLLRLLHRLDDLLEGHFGAVEDAAVCPAVRQQRGAYKAARVDDQIGVFQQPRAPERDQIRRAGPRPDKMNHVFLPNKNDVPRSRGTPRADAAARLSAHAPGTGRSIASLPCIEGSFSQEYFVYFKKKGQNQSGIFPEDAAAVLCGVALCTFVYYIILSLLCHPFFRAPALPPHLRADLLTRVRAHDTL